MWQRVERKFARIACYFLTFLYFSQNCFRLRELASVDLKVKEFNKLSATLGKIGTHFAEQAKRAY